MGLNEVKLALPVPYPATCILEQVVGARHAREIMETGELFAPERLLEMGLVDQVLPLEEVIPKALQKAKELAAQPARAFALIKSNRTEPVREKVRGRLVAKEQLFVDHWHSEKARKRLTEASKKF
jgi:enoyl-CoA hydratase/carnithine racemase